MCHRNSLGLLLSTMFALGCSGKTDNTVNSVGGSTTVGQSSTGGRESGESTSTSAIAGAAGSFGLGGTHTSGGNSSMGGVAATGGSLAAGGTRSIGGAGSTVGGALASGGSSGSSSNTGGSSAANGTICANPVVITKPAIADFESYDGSDLSNWYFPLGGDTSVNVYAGPFGYGDIKGTDSTGQARTDLPKTFDMVAGYNNSKYALRIADSMAMNSGGGQGLWLSSCLDATHFNGVSFWVRGNSPTGSATLTVSMQDTLSSTPSTPGGAYGTCPGTGTTDPVRGIVATCVHPTFLFPVTSTWTQIQASWASFTAGSAAGTPVKPNGRNITHLQLDVGLNWVPADGGVYAPVPAPYELVTDSWAFY